MKYILLSEEFLVDKLSREVGDTKCDVDDIVPIYESWDRFSRSTGGYMSKMLGGTEKCGKETFDKINRNVDALEQVIDNYNKKHMENKIGSNNILELKIDRAKLDLSYLLSMTTLSTASFIADVCTANILNFKILIRPIRNARIITLGYKYYLALIRHTIQNALISLELASDMFFIQIINGIKGQSKKTRELISDVTEKVNDKIMEYINSEKTYDGDMINPTKSMNKSQIEYLQKCLKMATQNARTTQMNQYSDMRYTQNLFQEFGKQSENVIKQNQDKEIQTMAEQFNHLGNTISQDARDIVGNYAQMVKLSAESRAQSVCAKINIAMLDVMKMFSTKYIDGYIDAFEEMSIREKAKQKRDALELQNENLRSELLTSESNYQKQLKHELEEQSRKSRLSEEYSKEIKDHWRGRGFDKLFTKPEFDELCSSNNTEDVLKRYMSKYLFDDDQIKLFICDNTLTLDNFDKIYTNGVLTGWVMNYKNDSFAEKMKERLLEQNLEEIFSSEDFMKVCKKPSTLERTLKNYKFSDDQVDLILNDKSFKCSIFSPILDKDDNVVGWKKRKRKEDLDEEEHTITEYLKQLEKRGFNDLGNSKGWKSFVGNPSMDGFKSYLVSCGFNNSDAQEIIDDDDITKDDFSLENKSSKASWHKLTEDEKVSLKQNKKRINDIIERGFASIISIDDFDNFCKKPTQDALNSLLVKYGFNDKQVKLITQSRKYKLSSFAEVYKDGEPCGYELITTIDKSIDDKKPNVDTTSDGKVDDELEKMKNEYLARGLDKFGTQEMFDKLFSKKPEKQDIIQYLLDCKFKKRQALAFYNNTDNCRDNYLQKVNKSGNVTGWDYISKQPSSNDKSKS